MITTVWIDHAHADLYRYDGKFSLYELENRKPEHHHFSHHNHPEDNRKFYNRVANLLKTDTKILIIGPSTAKFHLLNHIKNHDPIVAQNIVGLETVDHMTVPQIQKYILKYFHVESNSA